MNQEAFDRLSREEQRRLVAKTYGEPVPPPAIQSEVKRRQARRALNVPLTQDYEPADRCSLTLQGPPRSKKNSLTALGVQSPAYRKYHADALDQLRFAKKLKDIPYNINAQFYVDGWGKAADLIGLEQALADTLQAAGVVTNDKQFGGWDGSRKHEDHGTEPRTEITITPLESAA
jgi:hypothetical protein